VARDLPITEGSVWLSSFLTLSMVFIACVCLQCFASGYMRSRKTSKTVPLWARRLIDLSLLRIPFLDQDEDEDEDNMEKDMAQSDKSGSGSGTSSIPMQILNPLSDKSSSNNVSSVEEGGGPGQHSGSYAHSNNRNGSGDHPHQHDKNKDTEEMLLLALKKKKYTWQRASRSFDRFSRIVIPLVFSIMVGIDLGNHL
jgi:hypothetical protein